MSRELALCLLALAYVAFAAARSGAGTRVLFAFCLASFAFTSCRERPRTRCIGPRKV